MDRLNQPSGYANRREGNQLRLAIRREAHRDFVWKMWESSIFGTPNFRPEPGFTPGGEFIVASLGTFDFTFDVADWDRAVLPHLSKRMIQPRPDGGFRGGDFPTHFQELAGSWESIAELLSFAAVYRRDKACDMVDLLEIGMTFFGQFHRHRFDVAGEERLVAEQIIGALYHHYGDAKTRTRAARRMPRALPVLVRVYTHRFDATLYLAESTFGITIALESIAESHLQRVLWSTAHLHEDLHDPISIARKQQVMGRLERRLDHWDTAGAPSPGRAQRE